MENIKYTEDEFEALLNEHKLDWTIRENGAEKPFVFKNFIEAFQFMGKVAVIAENQNHHPEWTNVYNKVFMRFSTHDAGGLTQKDLDMILAVEKL